MTTALSQVAPYALRDDVLPADEVAALLDWTVARQDVFEPTMVGAGEHRRHAPDERSSLRLPVGGLAPWRKLLRERFDALLPGLLDELAMGPFEIRKAEFQMVSHNDGDHLRRHIDTQVGSEGLQRALTLVYYFHAEPRPFEGGALRLHPFIGDDGATVDLEPRSNRIVAFPAWAPHEVLPTTCASRRFADSRFSINYWLYRAAPTTQS